MKKSIIVVLLVAGGFAFVSDKIVKYPFTKKIEITNNYFGVNVADPYRWLEFDGTPESEAWINDQNQTTENYLQNLPARSSIRSQLQQLSNYPVYSSPQIVNGVYYFFRNDGIQMQSVFFSQKDLKSEPQVFIDPGKLSNGGAVNIDNIAFSKKGKYVAYTVKTGGSDWQTAYLMDVATKQPLTDKLEWIKLSTIQWQGDDGFYYSRYPEPKGNGRFSNQSRYHSVYFHKVGDAQAADKLVYEDKEHPYQYHYAQVTEDDRYLIIYTSEGGAGNQIMLRDLNKDDNAPFKTLLDGFKYEARIFDNDKKNLYAITNISAPRYRAVFITLSNPYVNNWETVIPEQKELLQSVSPAGGNWFVTHLKDASATMSEYTMGGYKLHDISTPAFASVALGAGRSNDNEFVYGVNTFTRPSQLYRVKISNGKPELFKGAALPYSPDDFETKQFFFNSEDGTPVPMFLVYKKGLQLNGNNPVLMTGFGGLNHASTPEYNASALTFIQRGGVYAVVNTRGGAEYGEKWHIAGMARNKQNAFDDFASAAQYLQDEKYTDPSKTAIEGSNHGGLLVAATMVERPELFKVVLPDAALLDMLRYEKFTTAYGWEGEYGTSDEREEFDNLYSYSPLQNLKSGVKYPATFITTSDKDDRIVPAHSYKFAAALQELQAGSNPVLIRVSRENGKTTAAQNLLEKETDRLAFLMQNLGM